MIFFLCLDCLFRGVIEVDFVDWLLGFKRVGGGSKLFIFVLVRIGEDLGVMNGIEVVEK